MYWISAVQTSAEAANFHGPGVEAPLHVRYEKWPHLVPTRASATKPQLRFRPSQNGGYPYPKVAFVDGEITRENV